MGATVSITKTQRGGAYADVVDFLVHKAAVYGSTASAAANVIRSSRTYQAWLKDADSASQRKRRAS